MAVGGSSASARSRSVETSISAEASPPSKRVALLLESIPVELQARAAFQCGAHARALLYFETHVRAKENGALNPAALRSASYSDEDVSFFQVAQHIAAACPLAELPVYMQHSPVVPASERLGLAVAWLEGLCVHAGSVWETRRARWAVRTGTPAQWGAAPGRPGDCHNGSPSNVLKRCIPSSDAL